MRNRNILLLSVLAAFTFVLSPMAYTDGGSEIENENSELAREEVQSAYDHIAEGAQRIGSGALEVGQTSLNFVVKRIPNSQELIYDVLMCAFIDMFLNGMGLDFGNNNPAAKNVVRDLGKVFSAAGKSLQEVEVGGTGLKFDTANFAGQIEKAFGKSGLIILLMRAGYNAEQAGEISNYPADAIARMFVLAGIERQRRNSTEPFFEYFGSNFDPNWIVRGAAQTVPKNLAVTEISNVMKKLKIGDTVCGSVFDVGNYFFPSTNLDMNFGVLKTANLFQGQNHNPVAAYVAAFSLVYVAKAATGLVNTYLLAVPARIIMDVIDWAGVPATVFTMSALYACKRMAADRWKQKTA